MNRIAIRQRLIRRRRQLLARYRDELERAEEQGEAREPEDVERATDQWDSVVLSRLGDADEHALREVVAALRRLDDGGYGVCTSCEQPIDAHRLEAVPWAALCIDCANEQRPTDRVAVRR